MYTIIQTAVLNSLNPEAYLGGAIASIANALHPHPINRISELMPWCR